MVSSKLKRPKSPPTIDQRVDVLLREGVDAPETWMAVERFVEDSSADRDANVEYERLHAHHLAECAFLRDVIRELCSRVWSLTEEIDSRYDGLYEE